jgi:predicted nucleic acid-binding protein
MPTDSAEALRSLDVILAQTIEIIQDVVPVRRVLATARDFGLTAYDAAYLETARGQQLPLATLDRQLKDAAVRANVAIIP